MEKIGNLSLTDLIEHEFILAELISFLDIKTLFSRVIILNSSIKRGIESENYLLFQKFRDFLNVPSTLELTEEICKKSITGLFKKLVKALNSEASDFQPGAYYTDGGVDASSNYYFLQNVWKKTSIGYCTVSNSNVHVQSILKTVEIPPAKNNPMSFLVKPNDKLKIRVPYEEYLEDTSDSLHLLKNFQIHIKSGGYNAYVRSFAVFYSENEIRNSKFVSMTKRFLKIKTFEDIEKSKLDVIYHEEDTKNGVEIVEFDLSNKSKIERGLKTKDPSIYPLLWVYIKQKYINSTFDYEIKQIVAAKFLSLKLLTSSNSNSYANIDLYNLGLKTIPIDI